MLRTDSEAYSYWKNGKTFEALTYPTAVLAVGFTAWNINNISKDEFNALSAIGGLASGIAGMVFLNKMTKNREKAVQTYNQNIPDKAAIRIQPSTKGFGIVIVLK